MRKKMFLCGVIALMFAVGMFLFPCQWVNAAEQSDFGEVETLDSEPKFTFGFSNFAVSSSGYFAIASGNTFDQVIAVYDPDGNFVYGYRVRDFGSVAVSWEGDNVVICSVRSNQSDVVDRDGTILSKETFDKAAYRQIKANTKTIDEDTYIAKHWIFNHESFSWGSYTKLVRISNGHAYVLFERSPTPSILIIGGIVLFCAGIVFLVVFHLIRKKSQQNKQCTHEMND